MNSKYSFLFLAKLLSITFSLTFSMTIYANDFKKFIENNRIETGGWINGGATFNPRQTDGFNGPVVFADQANRFQLNQFNLYVQRPVLSETKSWDIGGRFDFLFGTDAIFTQAFGVPLTDVQTGELLKRSNWDLDICCASTRTYNIALPQAYLEMHIPVIGKNGLNLKVGHFYSPTGFETVPAPDNFFYTRAYSFNAGEPFTHTGVQANYLINKNWSVSGSAVTGSATGGWDGGWNRQLGNWGGVFGVMWTSDNQATTLNVTGTYGEISTRSNEIWAMYNTVLKHKFNSRTQLVLHHVHGFANGVLLNNLKYQGITKDAQWMGVVTHLYYELTNELSIGLRGEWFRDRDGFRNPSPFRVAAAATSPDASYAGDIRGVTLTPADYYAVTAGLNWSAAKALNIRWNAIKKLSIRPNVRYDRVDAYRAPAYRPYGGNKDQILFSLDFLLPF